MMTKSSGQAGMPHEEGRSPHGSHELSFGCERPATLLSGVCPCRLAPATMLQMQPRKPDRKHYDGEHDSEQPASDHRQQGAGQQEEADANIAEAKWSGWIRIE